MQDCFHFIWWPEFKAHLVDTKDLVGYLRGHYYDCFNHSDWLKSVEKANSLKKFVLAMLKPTLQMLTHVHIFLYHCNLVGDTKIHSSNGAHLWNTFGKDNIIEKPKMSLQVILVQK